MSIKALGLRAYSDALRHFNKVDSSLKQGMPVGKQTMFSRTLDQSLLRDSVDKGENFGSLVARVWQFDVTLDIIAVNYMLRAG